MSLKNSIANYQMSQQSVELVKQTKLLFLAGVVGSGKNTIINELLKSTDFYEIISHTTRSPRLNNGVMEKNAMDYHFISLTQAEKLLSQQAFIEAKYVHGNVYGTTASELIHASKTGKIAVTDIDVHGVTEYLEIKPDTHAVFLLPPDVETWLSRLEGRYGILDNHQDEIKKRFKTAYDEITHIMKDRRFILVVNDDITSTVDRIASIITGEKHQTSEYAYATAQRFLEYLDRSNS